MKIKSLLINHTTQFKVLAFESNEKLILSSLLDGKVKAHYLLWNVYFHSFHIPALCKILSLDINVSSSIVVAGSFSKPHHKFL